MSILILKLLSDLVNDAAKWPTHSQLSLTLNLIRSLQPSFKGGDEFSHYLLACSLPTRPESVPAIAATPAPAATKCALARPSHGVLSPTSVA